MTGNPKGKKWQAWDEVVITRALDLEQGTDLSYINIIKPWVLDNVLKFTNEKSNILDIGCGCGYLTNCIYGLNRQNITGIDISQISVDYANKKYSHINFQYQDICTMVGNEQFDLCTAVMVLNNCPNIDSFLTSVYKALLPNGHMLIVLPHPCFWPIKHIKNNSFLYEKDESYNIIFSTKGRSDYNADITYYHRSVSSYLNSLYKNGFQIKMICELCETINDKSPDIMCIHVYKPK